MSFCCISETDSLSLWILGSAVRWLMDIYFSCRVQTCFACLSCRKLVVDVLFVHQNCQLVCDTLLNWQPVQLVKQWQNLSCIVLDSAVKFLDGASQCATKPSVAIALFANEVINGSNSDKREHAVPTLTVTQIFYVLFKSILHGVKIKITRSIVPINLQWSINVTGVACHGVRRTLYIQTVSVCTK